jgi:hypothetical protein
VGEKPRFVEDARWRALAAVYCASTVEMMRGLFQSAVELLCDEEACRTQSACAALYVLQMMLEMDDVLRPFIVETDIPKTVINLMVRNPDHSIMHKACRRFIVALIDNKVTRNRAVADCIPPIIKAVTSNNRNLVASAFELMKRLILLNVGMKEMKAIPGFNDLVKETRRYITAITEHYGGTPGLW